MHTIREAHIERYLVREVEKRGGFVRKLKWIGQRSAPDRFISIPGYGVILIEVKRPKKFLTSAQAREHNRLSKAGTRCGWVNSYEGVDALMKAINVKPR